MTKLPKYYIEAEVAARIHRSKRWLSEWLRENPIDPKTKEAFYAVAGRTKLFTAEDIVRILDAILTQEEAERPAPTGNGHVYFMDGGDRVKIGFSRSLEAPLQKDEDRPPVRTQPAPHRARNLSNRKSAASALRRAARPWRVVPQDRRSDGLHRTAESDSWPIGRSGPIFRPRWATNNSPCAPPSSPATAWTTTTRSSGKACRSGESCSNRGIPNGRPNWSWGVAFPGKPQPPAHRGLCSDLEECKGRVKVVWSGVRASLTEQDIRHGREVMAASNALRKRWAER